MNNSVRWTFLLILPAFLWTLASPAAARASKPSRPAPPANVLTVGPGMAFALPSDAARAAQPGALIRIAPGSYTDCARWDANDLVIEGMGAGAAITGEVCNGKGLFITRGRNITVRNIFLKPPMWIVKSTAGKPARSGTREKLQQEHPELPART